MPFYEMKCNSCNHEEELLLNITEDLSKVECSECGESMKPQITTGNFILKGFGWAGKGNRQKPQYQKQIGVKVDHDKKNAMIEAGEKV